MLEVVLSNQAEELLAALLEQVAVRRKGALDPVHIVVPTHLLESYVKFGVAQSAGLAAHLCAKRLEPFLADIVAASFAETRVADRTAVERALLSLLCDEELLGERELGQVRDYLHAAGEES